MSQDQQKCVLCPHPIERHVLACSTYPDRCLDCQNEDMMRRYVHRVDGSKPTDNWLEIRV